MNKHIHTFIGCDAAYGESRVVIFGAPFDGTTSYRPGARFAPSAMRNESMGLETYSPYQDKDLTDLKIFDGGDLDFPFGNPKRVLDMILDFGQKIWQDEKIPVMIGGEHLVTLGLIRGAIAKYPNLHLIHFDAHTDLRMDYMGESLSHATVIRRCHELMGDGKIHQFGIRSGEKAEFEFAKDHTQLTKFDFEGLEKTVENLKGKPVYLTIDLDVLDSSVFPGTGTPEAGGVTFKELIKALLQLRGLNIVGADVNELSPLLDASGASTAVACKVLREVLLLI